jgi:hypothetical protein
MLRPAEQPGQRAPPACKPNSHPLVRFLSLHFIGADGCCAAAVSPDETDMLVAFQPFATTFKTWIETTFRWTWFSSALLLGLFWLSGAGFWPCVGATAAGYIVPEFLAPRKRLHLTGGRGSYDQLHVQDGLLTQAAGSLLKQLATTGISFRYDHMLNIFSSIDLYCSLFVWVDHVTIPFRVPACARCGHHRADIPVLPPLQLILKQLFLKRGRRRRYVGLP